MDRTEVNASPVQKALQGIKKYKYVLLTALLGVLLLLLPQNEKAADSGSATPSAAENFDREALQNEMEDILSSLDGVGKLSLMLTVEGGGAYELAQDETASLKARGEEVDEQTRKTETVVLGSGTSAEVVVTHSRYPRFVGALVVCEGGGKAQIFKKIRHIHCSVVTAGNYHNLRRFFSVYNRRRLYYLRFGRLDCVPVNIKADFYCRAFLKVV